MFGTFRGATRQRASARERTMQRPDPWSRRPKSDSALKATRYESCITQPRYTHVLSQLWRCSHTTPRRHKMSEYSNFNQNNGLILAAHFSKPCLSTICTLQNYYIAVIAAVASKIVVFGGVLPNLDLAQLRSRCCAVIGYIPILHNVDVHNSGAFSARTPKVTF